MGKKKRGWFLFGKKFSFDSITLRELDKLSKEKKGDFEIDGDKRKVIFYNQSAFGKVLRFIFSW